MPAKATAARHFTPPEYAEKLGTSVNTVLAWIKSGELKALNLASRTSRRPRYRISPEAAEQFELSRSVVPATAQSATARLRRQSLGAAKDYFA
jgi:predicted site-specific integrase-resolvase